MKRSIVPVAALLSLCLGCGKTGGSDAGAPDASGADRDRSPRVIVEPPCELGVYRCSGRAVQRCGVDGWETLQICPSAELCEPDIWTCALPPGTDAGNPGAPIERPDAGSGTFADAGK